MIPYPPRPSDSSADITKRAAMRTQKVALRVFHSRRGSKRTGQDRTGQDRTGDTRTVVGNRAVHVWSFFFDYRSSMLTDCICS